MLNKAQLIGRVGSDPEIKTVGESQVANFSLATSKKWKDKAGQSKESTEWHRIVVWGNLCKVVGPYVKKGMLLFVEGEIRTREYEKDNVKQRITEIFCERLDMLSRSEATQAAQEQAPAQQQPQQDSPFSPDSDLPF